MLENQDFSFRAAGRIKPKYAATRANNAKLNPTNMNGVMVIEKLSRRRLKKHASMKIPIKPILKNPCLPEVSSIFFPALNALIANVE